VGTAVQNYFGGQAALKFKRLANTLLAERLEVEKQAGKPGMNMRKDALYHVLHALDSQNGRGLTKEELQADTFLLLGAGSDPVALTISACIFYLLHNPSAYAKVTSEIRGAFSSPNEIRAPKVNNLPYLIACIQETLRMSPAAPSGFPRLVLPGGLSIPSGPIGGDGDGLGAVHIPAGTTVSVPAYAIHHNESYYPDSWSFRPERWLVSGETQADLLLARKAFCPFSTGPMDCAGKSMANLAFRLVLAHLLWRYDIRLSTSGEEDGNPNVRCYSGLSDATGTSDPEAREEGRRVKEYQMLDFVVGYRNGPIVEFKERVGV
jgi:cytochrome P450